MKTAEVDVPPAFIAALIRIVAAFSERPAEERKAGDGSATGAHGPGEKLAASYPSLAIKDTGPVPLDIESDDGRGGRGSASSSSAAAGEGAGHKRSRDEALSGRGASSGMTMATMGGVSGGWRDDGGMAVSGGASGKRSLGPAHGHRNPILYEIYDGRISNIKDFGAFVEMEGFPSKAEGLVYVGNIRAGARVSNPGEAVSRGQKVKVKVISIAGSKIGLSMKDVDQVTGQDLMESRQAPAFEASGPPTRDRDGGSSSGGVGGGPLRLEVEDTYTGPKRMAKRVSSPERFETMQLIASGVLPVTEYPSFNETTGILPTGDDAEEEFEVEVLEEEPRFLSGQMARA
ncbi:MAG: S1 RNA-binding domain-containing protein, partial [Desulfobacterales bacterium]|nr:S1 RNA-binding domain-containing protein [Desulfobacterales bacterium]